MGQLKSAPYPYLPMKSHKVRKLPMNKSLNKKLMNIYGALYKFYGPQGWWPGDSRLEIIVGAILTQNTAWVNVEKAIKNLKAAGAFNSIEKISGINKKKLAHLIRPAGYYNVKSERLKNLIKFFIHYGPSFRRCSSQKTSNFRQDLLSVNGVGPETCDSILLYAFNRPMFVVDAYTRRIFARHKFFDKSADYTDIQRFFMDNLPRSTRLYNEYHALIVSLAKDFCRTRPECSGCPINHIKTCK